MSLPFFYCSQLSRDADEQPYGTASIGEVWVLVEYPHGWGSRALEESDLSPRVKRYLKSTTRTIPKSKLLFIKQDRATSSDLTLYVVRCREGDPFMVRFSFQSYEDLLKIDIAAAAAGNSDGGIFCTEPLYLVCTHGRRDKCCAKFGFALYKSLRPVAGDVIWQSSHIGGDRFAANMVCFPHGLFYAHVTEPAGKALLDEYSQGRMLLRGYRGRACYGRIAQAAEFFIRNESGLLGVDDLRFVDQRRVSESSWVVHFVGSTDLLVHEVRITSRPSEFQTYTTCHSSEEQKVVQYVLEDYRIIETVSGEGD
jgi:hypothetical protein